jgi:hypothetical protein
MLSTGLHFASESTPYLLQTLVDCPKARSVRIHDRARRLTVRASDVRG